MSRYLELRIRLELDEQNIKHGELADRLGISGAYLSDIINGRRTGPKAQEHIKHIREILSI